MSRTEFKKHFNRGRQLASKRQFDAAINEFEQALRHKPTDLDTIFQLGNVSRKMGINDLAVKWYDVALQMSPGSVEIVFNRALALQNLGRNQAALEAYESVAKPLNKDPMFWNNLGVLRQQMSQTMLAIDALEKAVSLKPSYFEAWNNLGLSYFVARSGPNMADKWQPAFAKAESHYRRDPSFFVNRSTCHFGDGNYQEGWKDYAHRHDPKLPSSVIYHHDFPLWQGEDLRGKTLLIVEEQGIGDQITFLSALPELLKTGARLIIEVSHKLVDLIQRNFPSVRVVAADRRTIDLKRHHHYDWLDEPVDYAVPLGDAFYAMRPSIEGFPVRRNFLKADEGRYRKWVARLNELNSKPKIGISWRSSKITGARQGAYMGIDELAPWLAEADRYQFVNLQYGECEEELAQLTDRPDGTRPIINFEDLDLFDDIEDTCGLIASLDGVLSVRNSQACLAGALGVNTISFRGSHFLFGHDRLDPVYSTILNVYPRPYDPPINDQFNTALNDFESTYVRCGNLSNPTDSALLAKHFFSEKTSLRKRKDSR
ncbi:MAG: tetratricopeptide repeat protein [Kordiimonadaceae bacterium]|nr:tetratricopeptide repeat protein [Kordiimonadaceae bacterium]MBO6568436.1 tetratricopeptide repeat protein [Kordiimonadaceae bacterium]MBO6963835.1 tetratricopeptide repeat protein [Kordiimonadaceae bacterium]